MTEHDKAESPARRLEQESQNSDKPTRVYESDEVAVEWYAHRCIHSGRCVRSLPRVFNPRKRPWIDVNAGDSEAVARTVMNCPSGALQLGKRSGSNSESAQRD
ncbi:MAG TPA: (4Fe-4S)-binding protein [Gemmatimonadales bacterium]|nr:(4Fe-4S)-binding protein [Gemmatimonadales bacterium]